MPKLFRYFNGESSRRRNERELRLGYFSHVFADYHRLTGAQRITLLADLPAALRTVVEAVESAGDVNEADERQLDWGDIAILEDKILALQDDATVRRRTWQTRARYSRLVGPEDYQSYLASRPPDEADATVPVDALRADLRRLLGATHFAYSLAFVRENNRRRIMWKVMWWTFAVCATALTVAGVLVAQPVSGGLIATLLMVALFGSLGAYISVQRRLQDAPDHGDPVIGILGLHQFNSIQPFPLISGGVFAIVLYFVLSAKFMEGALFPVLPASGVPATMEAWSKLFIWSLLAGFAERLVPDTLDRLTNQARVAGAPMPAATPATVPSPADMKKDVGASVERDRDQQVVDAALVEASRAAAAESGQEANQAVSDQKTPAEPATGDTPTNEAADVANTNDAKSAEDGESRQPGPGPDVTTGTA